MAATIELAKASFEANFVNSLPGDTSGDISPRPVPNVCYSLTTPTPVKNPKIIGWSDALAEMLGISRPSIDDKNAAAILAGNQCLPGMQPYAARYGGHQFGQWAGQLGDGRAITLAEMRDRQGQIWDMQLKGAGPTPYSRFADGRAVLRSSVREFLCSEAMFHLGVPTTRALSLVLTGDQVVRDMLYDGNPEPEPGAIVCRMAPTFLRFGNFEILTANGELDQLQTLIDWTIKNHFPHVLQQGSLSPEVYTAWFTEIAKRTALMLVEWLRVGFVHGVMNTDNMSILGLTIDYGPYGWLDDYKPRWTPNTTDRALRYCFAAQPQVALWNLECLATALKPIFDKHQMASSLEEGMQIYIRTFQTGYRRMVLQKLGLEATDSERDNQLIQSLTDLLQTVEIDMTIFFRQLARLPLERTVAGHEEEFTAPLRAAYYQPLDLAGTNEKALLSWLSLYSARFQNMDATEQKNRQVQMNRVNPKYVLRNYMAQQAIDDATRGDYARIQTLLNVLQRPYDEQPLHEALAEKRPEWARHKVGCSALSCSS